jgi:hypothetical protein
LDRSRVRGLLVFSSANQFANLQWNTGVRYMLPAVPLLFLASVPVLQALSRVGRWALVGVSLLVSVAVSMTREDVPTAFRLLVVEGPTLPVITVLRKMASGYSVPVPAATVWIVFAALAAALFMIWRPLTRRAEA